MQYIDYISINNPNRYNNVGFKFDNISTNQAKVVLERVTFDKSQNATFDYEALISYHTWEKRIYSSTAFTALKFEGRNPEYIDGLASINDSTVILEPSKITIGDTEYNSVLNTGDVTDLNNISVFCNSRTAGDNAIKVGKIGNISIYENNVLTYKFCTVLDNNNVPCYYEEVNQKYYYVVNSAYQSLLTAGPLSHTLIAEPSSLRFEPNGGTSAFTVTSQTGWTCTTPTGFTLSTTAGTSGDTTITVTAPNYTGNTKKSEVVTVTDDDGFTINVTLKQKAYNPGGLYNCFLGDTEGSFYLGGLEVSNMYLGEVEVYSSGPFIGLKLSPSTIQFYQDSGLTSSMKVKSSEAWTLALPNDATWLSASTLSGVSGETTVTLSTTEENTGDTRTAVITATTTSFSATCTVNQNVTHYVSWIFTTNPTNDSDYRDGIEIGDFWSADAEFRIKGTMQGYSTGNSVLANYDGRPYVSTRWFWVGGNMYYDMNSGRIQTQFTPTYGVNFDYTISNWGVYDNLTSSYVMSGTPKPTINAGVVWLNMRTCKISSIEIKQGNTVVFDGKAAIDDITGYIGLYDSVSKTLFYNSNLSMTYGE